MATKDISDIQVLQAVSDGWRDWNPATCFEPIRLLMERTGQAEKVCVRAIERACRRDLLDWGTTVYKPFITTAGHAALAAAGIEQPGGSAQPSAEGWVIVCDGIGQRWEIDPALAEWAALKLSQHPWGSLTIFARAGRKIWPHFLDDGARAAFIAELTKAAQQARQLAPKRETIA